jgi:hypothetical protein
MGVVSEEGTAVAGSRGACEARAMALGVLVPQQAPDDSPR